MRGGKRRKLSQCADFAFYFAQGASELQQQACWPLSSQMAQHISCPLPSSSAPHRGFRALPARTQIPSIQSVSFQSEDDMEEVQHPALRHIPLAQLPPHYEAALHRYVACECHCQPLVQLTVLFVRGDYWLVRGDSWFLHTRHSAASDVCPHHALLLCVRLEPDA